MLLLRFLLLTVLIALLACFHEKHALQDLVT